MTMLHAIKEAVVPSENINKNYMSVKSAGVFQLQALTVSDFKFQ